MIFLFTAIFQNAKDSFYTTEYSNDYFDILDSESLPVVTDDTPAAEHEIIVGIARDAEDVIPDIAALGEDGFVIRVCENKLYLLGASGRGNLYAVYDFLEKKKMENLREIERRS